MKNQIFFIVFGTSQPACCFPFSQKIKPILEKSDPPPQSKPSRKNVCLKYFSTSSASHLSLTLPIITSSMTSFTGCLLYMYSPPSLMLALAVYTLELCNLITCHSFASMNGVKFALLFLTNCK